MGDKLAVCRLALNEVERAEEHACSVISASYPPGTEVSWDRGGHTQYGVVVYNSTHRSGDRMRVKNDYTGKTYWITFYDIEVANRTPAHE